jgi:hypothetical protein
MTKEQLQQKKQKLEEEFKKTEETRLKAQDMLNQCVQQMTRLQGAYAQLEELERELFAEEKGLTPIIPLEVKDEKVDK